MTYGEWQDVSIEARAIISGAMFLLVVQIFAAITEIMVNVWKLLTDGRKVKVKERRRVVRFFKRKVWKRAEDYRSVDDPRHPHNVLRAK